MLNLAGPAMRFCDGVSRRAFLRIGAFAFGAHQFGLADLMRADETAPRARHKAVINVLLAGGPPHQDMWDIKTDAPAEIRGEFRPIATRVPGIQIGECFPRLAGVMDKCVPIRSVVVGNSDRHALDQCHTGWPFGSISTVGGRPSIGAVLSKLRGAVDPAVPAFVGLAKPTTHRPWGDCGTAGFLGPSHAPFQPDGAGQANLTLNGVTAERLGDRCRLLQAFDRMRRDLDASGVMTGMDASRQRALGVLTSSRLLDALDISKEPIHVRERYGDGQPYQFQFDGAPTVNDQLLLARRLVEAGVRCVTITYGRWDSHSNNFDLVRDHGGKLDQCLSALIEDLDQRGLLDDVSVVAWGEFGRTPRINERAGRDHWTPVSCALMAGGGIRAGQVIGATNRLGETPATRPVTPGEIVATLYHNLGLHPATDFMTDPTGRPQHITENLPLRELV